MLGFQKNSQWQYLFTSMQTRGVESQATPDGTVHSTSYLFQRNQLQEFQWVSYLMIYCICIFLCWLERFLRSFKGLGLLSFEMYFLI